MNIDCIITTVKTTSVRAIYEYCLYLKEEDVGNAEAKEGDETCVKDVIDVNCTMEHINSIDSILQRNQIESTEFLFGTNKASHFIIFFQPSAHSSSLLFPACAAFFDTA